MEKKVTLRLVEALLKHSRQLAAKDAVKKGARLDFSKNTALKLMERPLKLGSKTTPLEEIHSDAFTTEQS